MKIRDIIFEMEKIAPLSLAESWDNPGFLLGVAERNASKVFVCLEVHADP